MSILTKKEILKEIKKKNIAITPFDVSAIGPGSVDLTLDDQFRVFTKGKTYDVRDSSNYHEVTKLTKKKKISNPTRRSCFGYH